MPDFISRFVRVVMFIFRPLPRVPRLLRMLLFGLTVLGLSVTWNDIRPWFDADPAVRWASVAAGLLFVLAFFACLEYQKRLDSLIGVKVKALQRMCSAEIMPELPVNRQKENDVLLLRVFAAFRNADALTARVKFPRQIEAKVKLGRFRRVRVSMEMYGMSSVRRGDPMRFYDYHAELWYDLPPKDETICHTTYWCRAENAESLVAKSISTNFELEFISHPDRELSFEVKAIKQQSTNPTPSKASGQVPPS